MSWRDLALGDVLTLQRGFDITKAQQSPGPFPVVSSSGTNSYHSEFKCNGPGVIIGRKGTLGTAFFLEGAYWPHDTSLWVKDFKGNDPRFCYYLLKSLGLEKYDVGSSNPTLNRNHLHLLEARVPSPEIQHRIANILSAYDDLIENNTRRIAILEDTARRLFEEWFREGGETAAEVRLGELCIVHRGRSYRKQDIGGNEGAPFVNLKCILRDGGFRADGIKSYCGVFKETQRVVEGDIVMAVTDMTQERRIVARSARVANLGAPFGVISMDLVKIEPRAGVPGEFLYALLRWSAFADVVKHYANGANVLHLAPSLIEQALVEQPPQERMTRFAEIVRPRFALADSLVEASTRLRVTRDLLLPKLISGEIEVRAAEEELETAAA